jgi:hypothetical protein
MDNDLDGLVGAFKAVVGEVSKSNKALNDTTKSFRSLTSLATRLRNDQIGIEKLNRKDLVSIKAKIQAQQQELKDNKDLLRNKINQLQQEEASQDLIDKHIDALNTVNAELEEQDSLTKSLLATAQERLEVEEKIDDALGLGGNAIKGIEGALNKLGMGGLTKQLGLEDAQKKMKEVATATMEGKTEAAGFGDKMKVLKAGAGSMGKSLLTNLKDPLVIGGFLLKEFFDVLVMADKQTAELAKGMNMTYQEANNARAQLSEAANLELNRFVTTKGLQESLMSINKSLGTSVVLTDKNLAEFTSLREIAGFTNEELLGINALSLTTGKTIKETTGEFMAQAKISSVQNGVMLNEKDLAKSIKDVSAATTLSLGKNPKLIGEAVATSKALGMELSKVDDIAGSLLNFEQSIEDELSAELLLNKDMNLEKARQAALNNDLATVAKEISEQAGSSAEFAEMNRIQQEALAKSVGMSREELAKTLFTQEQLVAYSGDEAAAKEKAINASIEAIGLEATQKKLAEEGVESLEKQAGVADQLTATVEKLKEVFVSIAPAILSIAEMLANVLGVVGLITGGIGLIGKGFTIVGEKIGGFLGFLKPIAGFMEVLAKIGVITAAYFAFQSLAAIPIVGFALGAAAAAATVAAGFGLINGIKKAGDVMSPADGKTQVSTKEGGLFELSKNDDLIAAPGAAAKMNSGGGSTVVQQDNSETNNLLKQLITTNQEGNSLQKKKPELSPVGLYEVQ